MAYASTCSGVPGQKVGHVQLRVSCKDFGFLQKLSFCLQISAAFNSQVPVPKMNELMVLQATLSFKYATHVHSQSWLFLGDILLEKIGM